MKNIFFSLITIVLVGNMIAQEGNKKNGSETIFYPNGYIKLDASYKDGVLHGPYTSFYENGNIKEDGQYKDNVKVGEWSYFSENGNLLKVTNEGEVKNNTTNLKIGPIRIKINEDGKETNINSKGLEIKEDEKGNYVRIGEIEIIEDESGDKVQIGDIIIEEDKEGNSKVYSRETGEEFEEEDLEDKMEELGERISEQLSEILGEDGDEKGRYSYDYDYDYEISSDDEVDGDDDRAYFMFGLDLGVAGYAFSDGGTLNTYGPDGFSELDYGRSRNIALNGYLGFDIHKNIGIVTGLRLDFKNYRLTEHVQLNPVDNTFLTLSQESIENSVTRNDKTVLKVNHLQVPLYIKIQTADQDLQLAFGALAGLKMSSALKEVYTIEGAKFKDKRKENFNLSPFDVSLTARANYKAVGIYATYALTELSNTSPVRTPFTVGISFGSF